MWPLDSHRYGIALFKYHWHTLADDLDPFDLQIYHQQSLLQDKRELEILNDSTSNNNSVETRIIT